MKKILVIALIAVFVAAMFFACEKDNPQSTKSQDALECSFDDIDSMSSEVASFHVSGMTYACGNSAAACFN